MRIDFVFYSQENQIYKSTQKSKNFEKWRNF